MRSKPTGAHLFAQPYLAIRTTQWFTCLQQSSTFMALSNFELALALSNLIGSALSSLGSGFIILCYVFLPVKKHYRHLLILNLAIAGKHQYPQKHHKCSPGKLRLYQCYDQCNIWISRSFWRSIVANTSLYCKWIYRATLGSGNSRCPVYMLWD